MRLGRLGCALMLPLLLAACGGDEAPPTEAFKPLDYSYLTKINLNVGSVDVQNHAMPQSGEDGAPDVSDQSPVPPEPVLEEIGHDRLFAAGLTGTAVFVIDQASILRGSGGALNGVLAVHLDVLTAGGTRAGYAEARVVRQHVPGSDGEDAKSALYDLTKQMTADMNVELEFQIRRTLRDWMVTGSAAPAAVASEPLSPSQSAAPPPQGSPVPEAAPPPPPEQDAPPPEQMSPPPGFLQQPPSAY